MKQIIDTYPSEMDLSAGVEQRGGPGKMLEPLHHLHVTTSSEYPGPLEDLSQRSDFSRRNSFPASGGQKLQSLSEEHERSNCVGREALNSRVAAKEETVA
mmetsp:Transcript_9788/g.12837  ORF Transcript_9788/g.12837 Transcript_9788/m.12837 type:complete len:100 (-) Transcript_9788:271-570(-)